MEMEKKTGFSLTTGVDLAFALVVFISFFTIFGSAPITNPVGILIIIFLGIAYVSFGIYGFSYAQQSGSNLARIAYFAVQLVLGSSIVYLGRGAGINALILLPLVAHTAMLLDQDKTLIVNVGIIFAYIVSVYSYSGSLLEIWRGAPFFFAGQVVILIFTQMAVTELKARIRLETLAEELSEANQHLKEYASQVKELTITQERNRMAREIHDGLGHYLTILNMQLKAAQATLSSDRKKSSQMIDSAIQITSEALLDVRSSVFALRQGPEEIKPLVDRIRNLVDSSSTGELQVTLSVKGDCPSVSPQVDLTLYRAVQEMINNVIKHANARHADLTFDFTAADQIILSCVDDGQGQGGFEKGFGIVGLTERVKLLHGSVKIETQPNAGFTIMIQIPR
jgi:signal transduction histidine kinase